jgi:hypothetical protein
MPKTIIDLQVRDCRYIIAGPNQDRGALFCAEETVDVTRSMCPLHYAMCYHRGSAKHERSPTALPVEKLETAAARRGVPDLLQEWK